MDRIRCADGPLDCQVSPSTALGLTRWVYADMTHAYSHLIRAFGNIPLTTIEVTAAQMVLCMNLTSFAWSVHDGRRKEEDLDAQQLEHRVVEFPSLLEFLGYA